MSAFSLYKKVFNIVLLGLLTAITPHLACAGEARFVWLPNSGVINGYRLYFGNVPGEYNGVLSDNTQSPVTIPLDALSDPQNPRYTRAGLGEGTWYFALTAYGDTGESGYTAEISTSVAAGPPTESVPALGRWGIIFLVMQFPLLFVSSARIMGTEQSR